MGFGGVEFDVMLSSDGVPVLIHDETLDRTTSGQGLVAHTPYSELAKLDAGVRFGGEYRGERIPSFEQAASLCLELGVWANVEIKPAPGFERQTGHIAAKLASETWRGAALAPLLSSFHPEALDAARSAAPHLPRGLLADRLDANWATAARDLACVSIHCNCAFLTPEQARAVRDSGYWLLCYTVNEPALARELLSWGVDAIFTDRLDLIPPDFS